MSANKDQFKKLAHNLKRIKEQQKDRKVTFAVVYDALYALIVHEDLEAVHTNGQAKYLEEPMRKYAKHLTQMVKQLIKQKKTLRQALKIAGEWLLEKSQELVPVDTGALKQSGKVKIISSN